MKLLILTILLLIFTISNNAFSKNVSPEFAATIAKNFYYERSENIAYDSIVFIEPYSSRLINNIPLFYIFNIKNDKGFVIVSAQNNAYPVLGYSFSGRYDENNSPPAFTEMLDNFSNQIIGITNNSIPPTQKITGDWQKYSYKAISKSNFSSIPPLLSTTWAQGCFYNDSCPPDAGGSCGHVVTGCIATAMAQLMKYYDYPLQGTGAHSYTHPNYGYLSADFANTTYDWANMPNSLSATSTTNQVSAVAQLMSHCGISVEMSYSAGSSGAADPRDEFINFFNYSSTVQFLYKDNYTDSIWKIIVRSDLDSARPVYSMGFGSGGHAYICDGYQGSDHFHFNWGWGGAYDGYFYLSALNPGGSNFSIDQSALINLRPTSGNCSGTTVMLASNSNFNDGSNALDYIENADCKWLIQPPSATSIALNFTMMDLLANDSVKIYDGSSITDPLIGSFSGNNIPPTIFSSGGSLFLHFQSDNTLNSSGWEVEYVSTMPNLFCSGYNILTSNTGSFSDGSGSADYQSYADCRWIIKPAAADSIQLTFNNFNTESGFDFANVYDGESTGDLLLGSFSGGSLPPVIMSSGGEILVNFVSDGAVVGSGWDVSYLSFSSLVPTIISGSATTFCQGDSAVLGLNSSFTSYQWLLNNSPIPSAIDSIYIAKQSGAYSLITNTTDTLQSIQITVNPLPIANAGTDADICLGDCVSLIGSGGLAYQWSNGIMNDTILVCPVNDSNFILTVTDANNCSNTDEVEIFIHNVQINLGNDTLIIAGQSIVLDAGAGFIAFDWFDGSSSQSIMIDTSFAKDSVICFVDVIDDFNCTASDTIIVYFDNSAGIDEVDNDDKIQIYPNPNNGEFFIKYDDIKGNISVKIFNAQLQEVFQEKLVQVNGLNNQKKINVSHLSNGAYIMYIVNDQHILTRKLIINKK